MTVYGSKSPLHMETGETRGGAMKKEVLVARDLVGVGHCDSSSIGEGRGMPMIVLAAPAIETRDGGDGSRTSMGRAT